MVLDMDAAASAVDSLEAALATHRGSAANWDAASEYVYTPSRGTAASDGLVLRHVIPLPAAFVAQTSTYAYKSFMGLFPEIGRAWVSSDTRLVLWSYAEERILHGAPAADDYYSYEGFDQIIVTASLVRPRSGVFIDDVQYLIAVATTVEVTLLGVTFSGNGPLGEISLIPTNISVATDGVIMHKIVSTPDGRIFMGGSDGNVHEFVYYGETTGWTRALLGPRAAKRPQKLVHKSASFIQYLIPAAVKDYFSRKDEVLDIALDTSRNALYTLSTSGTLAVYDVSHFGTAHVIRSVDVAFEARSMLSYALPSSEREFVAIFPVAGDMSSVVNLVVVSSFGERVYFACSPAPSRSVSLASTVASGRQPVGETAGDFFPSIPLVGSKRPAPDAADSANYPTLLKCVGARPTPVREISGPSQRPCIHMALWASGAVLLCDLREGDDDRLYSVFPDPAAGRAIADASFEGQNISQRWPVAAQAAGGSSYPAARSTGPVGGAGTSGHAPRALLPPAGQLRPVEAVFETTLGTSKRSSGERQSSGLESSPDGFPSDRGEEYGRRSLGYGIGTPGIHDGMRASGQPIPQALHTLAIAPVREWRGKFGEMRDGSSTGILPDSSSNEIQTSHVPPLLEPPSLFWVLTDRTMHLYEHAKPTQRLSAILANSSGAMEDQDLELYFRHHGVAEASAFCLELAILDPNLAGSAARALYMYGGRALLQTDQGSGYPGQHVADSGSADWASTGNGASTPGRGSLQALRRNSNLGPGTGRYATSFDLGRPSLREGPPATFSGVYDGMCIYLANALQPVWHEYICSSRNPGEYQRLAFQSDTLNTCRERMRALVAFLAQFDPDAMLPWDDEESSGQRDGRDGSRGTPGNTSSGYHGHGGGDGHASSGMGTGSMYPHGHHHGSSAGNRTIQDRLYGRTGLVRMKKSSEARRAEVGAIHNIKQLAIRSKEALGFLSILSDHHLHRIMPALQIDVREELSKMQFCDLVARVPGAAISTALIEVLFSGLSSVQDDLEPLCKLLQSVCPSYFDDDDMTLQNGLQRLRVASELAGVAQPGHALHTEGDDEGLQGASFADRGMLDMDSAGRSQRDKALRLAEEAVALLKPLSNRIYSVQSVCTQLEAVGAVPSAIELAIVVGDTADHAGDKGRATQSYECALGLVEKLVGMSVIGVEADGTEGATPGGGDGLNSNFIPSDDAQLSSDDRNMKDAALRVAFGAKSEWFLDMLYSTLIRSKEGQRELMQRPSSRLEGYLNSHQLRDLLWKYFARQGRHADAASVLIVMAEEDSDATLMDRLGYLTRALHNAKTAAAAGDVHAGGLESDVKDYLDVARVQLKIREELARRPEGQLLGGDRDSILSDLDAQVVDLTVLYNEYAVPYGLLECTLDILRCGSYRDDQQVRELWMKLVDSELAESHSRALLEQKIVSLGREYYPSDIVFPTRFIVDLLERRTFDMQSSSSSSSAGGGGGNGSDGRGGGGSGGGGWGSSSGWVANALVTVGVPVGEIVDAYRTMIESSSSGGGGDGGSFQAGAAGRAGSKTWSWSDERGQLHVILATERALAAWAARAAGGGGGRGGGGGGAGGAYDMERRILAAESEKALRTVALCKSRLRGMSNAMAKSLVQTFDQLEASLQLVGSSDRGYF